MAKLLLNLRHVPDDEADEVRALLKRHGLNYYETPPSLWGINPGGIWLRDDDQAVQAKQLLAEYQAERQARARAEYEARKRAGTAETLGSTFRANPVQFAAYVLIIILLVLLMTLPFILLGA